MGFDTLVKGTEVRSSLFYKSLYNKSLNFIPFCYFLFRILVFFLNRKERTLRKSLQTVLVLLKTKDGNKVKVSKRIVYYIFIHKIPVNKFPVEKRQTKKLQSLKGLLPPPFLLKHSQSCTLTLTTSGPLDDKVCEVSHDLTNPYITNCSMLTEG